MKSHNTLLLNATLFFELTGDDGGVAWVILGDVLLNLAHQVSTHIGGLGVDATGHAAEQSNGGAAQAVAGDGLQGEGE